MVGDALEEKLGGPHAGADDYVTKPFVFEKLLARIQVLLRRTSVQVVADSGNRSTDIASETAKETFFSIRDVRQVPDEPAAYGKAYGDFVQKQMDLFLRTAQSFADMTRKVGIETAELTSRVGEEFDDKTAANAEGAADTAGSAAKKAA